MKRVTSLFIVMFMLLTVFTTSFAYATDNAVQLDDLNYNTYTLEFDNIDTIMNTNSNVRSATVSDVKAYNAKNLESVKQMILKLDLDQYNTKGLKNYYLQQIESLMDEEGYILNYSITLPKLAIICDSDSGSFGSYEGYPMYYTTSSYTSTTEKMKETNKSKIEKYFAGALSVVMNFVSKTISIPYSLLTTFGGEVYSESFTKFYTVVEKTDRLISIQDKDDKYGSPSAYVATYKDQKCEASGYFIFHPNEVGENPQTSGSTTATSAATEDYNDTVQTRKNVWDHYKRTHDQYIKEYSVSAPTIKYEE